MAEENWMDAVRRDLRDMSTTWDEAEEMATNKAERYQRLTTVHPSGYSGHLPNCSLH